MANEGRKAVDFVDAVLAKCQEFRRATFLVVLDRANKDDTLDRMREHAKTTPGLTVIWAPENRGPNRPAGGALHRADLEGCNPGVFPPDDLLHAGMGEGLPPHRVKLTQRQRSTIKSEK